MRVRNGEVCYWPNVGYGRFGAKVAMREAPLGPARLLGLDLRAGRLGYTSRVLNYARILPQRLAYGVFLQILV